MKALIFNGKSICTGEKSCSGNLLWGDALGRSCSGEGKFSLGVKVALGR